MARKDWDVKVRRHGRGFLKVMIQEDTGREIGKECKDGWCVGSHPWKDELLRAPTFGVLRRIQKQLAVSDF